MRSRISSHSKAMSCTPTSRISARPMTTTVPALVQNSIIPLLAYQIQHSPPSSYPRKPYLLLLLVLFLLRIRRFRRFSRIVLEATSCVLSLHLIFYLSRDRIPSPSIHVTNTILLNVTDEVPQEYPGKTLAYDPMSSLTHLLAYIYYITHYSRPLPSTNQVRDNRSLFHLASTANERRRRSSQG